MKVSIHEIPFTVSVNDTAPYTVTVGGELAVTAHVFPDYVTHEWHGEWAGWEELHKSPEVADLLDRSNKLVAKAAAGMKGSKGGVKGQSKGASRPRE